MSDGTHETAANVEAAVLQGHLAQYVSVFFFIGLLLVAVNAWQRFNDPSFPNRKTLPHTLVPLRYLFLRPAYQRARFTYLILLLSLYCFLVWPGPSILKTIGAEHLRGFSAEAWALVVAVVMTGVGTAPNSLRWLNIIEEQLRRWVHAWFLVPDGIEMTIGILDDARYEPPQSQINLVQSPLRENLLENLKLAAGTLPHRWARATILIAVLKQTGAGGVGPLKRAVFSPFTDDFKAICRSYQALQKDMEPSTNIRAVREWDEIITSSVNELLMQIYAYISWGIRSQADSDQEVDRTLEELGFRVPQRDGRRLFDIVAPAVCLVAGITMFLYLVLDAVTIGDLSKYMCSDLLAAMAASLMYGGAVFVALNRRSAMIEQKMWRQTSPRSFVPIVFRAGLVTWVVIVFSTALGAFGRISQSVSCLFSFLIGSAGELPEGQWMVFPSRIITALPWLLAGATMSAVLARSVGGDVRRTAKRQRVHDAIILGVFLGVAVILAQVIQNSAMKSFVEAYGFLSTDLIAGNPYFIGLGGVACGAVIGFMVPYACRANIVTPLDRKSRRALQELLVQAETAFGGRTAAENWVFMPHNELDGLAPAEAIQYKNYATGVFDLVAPEVSSIRQGTRSERHGRPMPLVIEGGRIAPTPKKRILNGVAPADPQPLEDRGVEAAIEGG